MSERWVHCGLTNAVAKAELLVPGQLTARAYTNGVGGNAGGDGGGVGDGGGGNCVVACSVPQIRKPVLTTELSVYHVMV